jgi:hypothetical protein
LSHAWSCRGTACRAELAHVPLGWLATILHVRIRRAEGETLDARGDVGVEECVVIDRMSLAGIARRARGFLARRQ